MKKSLFILIFLPLLLMAQNDAIELDEEVHGIITSDKGTYLVLEQGFMKIVRNDIYAEYYRQIYNDSTIVNPNTEIKDELSFSIIPYLNPNELNERIDFSKPKNLGFFIKFNNGGKYEFTSFGESLIDSIWTD